MNDALAQPELPLEGPIPDVDVLPRLVAWLGRTEWSGHVSVRSGDIERRLYFLDGHVQTATSTDPAESLTTWLVETGLLDGESVEQAATHLGSSERGLGFARNLVGLGMLSEAHLAEAELQRVVALAERVLSLRSGIYRCEIGAPPTEMVSHALDVPRLIATAVLDQWDPTWAMNVLGGMGAVLKLNTERLPEHEATGADEAYDLTLLRIDGRSPLGEVLERCPLPELAALRFLAACRLLGILEPTEARAPAPPPRHRPEPAAAPPREAPPVGPQATADEAPGDAREAEAPEPVAPAPEAVEEGDITTPGFYRPPASAPAPRSEEPLMSEEPARSGFGRVLLIVLILGLAGVVGWFGWVGLSEMSGPSGDAPPAREAAP